MTDISVERTSYQQDDRPWLLAELVGHQQSTVTGTIVLDFTKFVANTHYPNGFIPSGTVVGSVTTGGRGGAYDNAATDGRQTAVGHLYNAIRVPTDLTTKVAAAVVDIFAVVSESRLPANHGLDAAAKADLPLIKYRA